jgi:hypothetical protein
MAAIGVSGARILAREEEGTQCSLKSSWGGRPTSPQRRSPLSGNLTDPEASSSRILSTLAAIQSAEISQQPLFFGCETAN